MIDLSFNFTFSRLLKDGDEARVADLISHRIFGISRGDVQFFFIT